MIGGTGVQTLILGIITYRCDWDKEAEMSSDRLEKWGGSNPSENGSMKPKAKTAAYPD
ncbi:hypothetical protein AMTR_s00008p00177720 [Amborella trichopoda]|uniref:Uncharacterized protein n=3 Tax=Amborella trichopoda TaxID=13333 RepID=W1NIR2_AMBTC|nr:hypothetical protein AMTR_s00008p00177720 [Amborella trichopoda]